jgi:hypothetical protein
MVNVHINSDDLAEDWFYQETIHDDDRWEIFTCDHVATNAPKACHKPVQKEARKKVF